MDITEDYDDLPILHKKDVYFIQPFIAGGFRIAELESLNFIRKSIQPVTLADLVFADRNRISHQLYDAVECNGLHKDLRWRKVPTKEEMSSSLIIL